MGNSKSEVDILNEIFDATEAEVYRSFGIASPRSCLVSDDYTTSEESELIKLTDYERFARDLKDIEKRPYKHKS